MKEKLFYFTVLVCEIELESWGVGYDERKFDKRIG